MLIVDELDIIHTKEEYSTHIKNVTATDKDILKLSKDFDDWLGDNRVQLNEIYNSVKTDNDFIMWARKKYYFWSYNQEKKKILNEIDTLTAT